MSSPKRAPKLPTPTPLFLPLPPTLASLVQVWDIDARHLVTYSDVRQELMRNYVAVNKLREGKALTLSGGMLKEVSACVDLAVVRTLLVYKETLGRVRREVFGEKEEEREEKEMILRGIVGDVGTQRDDTNERGGNEKISKSVMALTHLAFPLPPPATSPSIASNDGLQVFGEDEYRSIVTVESYRRALEGIRGGSPTRGGGSPTRSSPTRSRR